jgi:GT2 family glycosyltransferase
MPRDQNLSRQEPSVRALRLAYLIPASATAGFYSQLAMMRLSLDQLGPPYRDARLIAAVGVDEGASVPPRWRQPLARVDVRFVRSLGDPSYRAQVNGRWSMVTNDIDVVIFADADTMPVAPFDDLLERVVDEGAVAGTIVYAPLRFPDDVSSEVGWQGLARRTIGRDIDLDHKTMIAGPRGVTHATPYCLNFGFVAMTRAVWEVLRPAYLRIEPEVAGLLVDSRFSAQVALALAICETNLPRLAVGLRYNFPNGPRAEAAHPQDARDVRTIHYLRTRDYDRQRIFADQDSFQAFLSLPLTGSSAVLQRRVAELTGGTYPFGRSDTSEGVGALDVSIAARSTARAVIVNFQRHDLVDACIRALEAGDVPPDEIVVVDNQSDPEALRNLADAHPSARTIANVDNVGYARACNQGAANATTDYVLFINPDVTVSPSCLAACVDEGDRGPNVAIVTPRLMRPDGRLDHACHRGLPTPLASLSYALRLNRLFPRSHRLARYTMSWLDTATVHNIEACSGAFMLVRRSDLEAVNGWDERYWFYGEDLDLCYRLGQAGKLVRYVGTATATHIKGASSGLHSRKEKPDRATRARILLLRESIVESHRLFFRQHLRSRTRRPVALAIEAMFEAQRLRIRTQLKLESLRGS